MAQFSLCFIVYFCEAHGPSMYLWLKFNIFTCPACAWNTLYNGALLTVGASCFLVSRFAMKHKITNSALNDLLKIIEMHCPRPNACCKSVHFLKIVSVSRHRFLNWCTMYNIYYIYNFLHACMHAIYTACTCSAIE